MVRGRGLVTEGPTTGIAAHATAAPVDGMPQPSKVATYSRAITHARSTHWRGR